jgi:hypothetical protein
MVTLAPPAPGQTTNEQLGARASGVGQEWRSIQARLFEALTQFYSRSETLSFTYSHDAAATMERSITGREPFLPIELAPISRVLGKLLSLATWPEGWNGADALRPDPAAIAYALTWILQLYSTVSKGGWQWIDPNVTASADGEVVFEWWYEQRKLTVYITNASATCLRVWGADINTQMAEGEIVILSEQQMNWRWLIGSPHTTP